MALTAAEIDDLVQEWHRNVVAPGLSVGSLLASNHGIKSISIAMAIRGWIDAWLQKANAEFTD